MSEYKPKFVANREWSKDIKFNNHWYHLKSLFDQSVCDYDFNQAVFDDTNDDIDFNQESLNLSINNTEVFDFNEQIYE